MIETKRPRGRPPKGESERQSSAAINRNYRAKRALDGRKELRLIVDSDISELFELAREQSGFSKREQSEFFAALVLKVMNKPWLGPAFALPIEKATEGEPAA